jgi:cytochrome c oxidase subunit IV
MHLRFERLSLVYAIVAPLILLIAMIAGLVPDGVCSVASAVRGCAA